MRHRSSLVASLVLGAALLMVAMTIAAGERAPGQVHAGGAEELSVTWISANGGLRVAGSGFRPRSVVSVRVGSAETIQIQVDEIGAVVIEVPLDPSDVGKEGTSVIVSGRARSGAARALVAASPPRAAGRGPVDLIPWSIGLILLCVVLLAILSRKFSKITRTSARNIHTEGK